MTDYFRSPHLIYRAIDSPNDNEFFHSISLDSEAFANSNASLMKPFTKKESEQRQINSEKALLGVLICLPAPPAEESSNKASFIPKATIPIGRMFLNRSSSDQVHHRNSTIGIDIIAQYQRQGYGSEAIEWVLNWGFKMAGLHRIEIGCFSYNRGALKLYEKLGFTLEGRKRESIWFDGAWHDTILLSMLEDEWRAKQAATKCQVHF